MKHKRKLLFAALAVLLVSLFAAGTLALFTVEGRSRNVITTGTVEVQLVERRADGSAYPEAPIKVMPDTTVDKVVLVKAEPGSADAFVRVQYTVRVTVDGKPVEATAEELTEAIRITPSDKWTLRDGWYYYDGTVSNGGETEPLFETVTFSKSMDNRYQNAELTLTLNAQAVQAKNNEATALTALGWPEG